MSLKDSVLGNKYLLGGSFVGVGGLVIAGFLQVADPTVQATGAGVVALLVAGGLAVWAKYSGGGTPPPVV